MRPYLRCSSFAPRFVEKVMINKRIVAALVLCAVASGVVAADVPAPGKQVPMTTAVEIKSDDSVRGAMLRYLLYLPADYDSNTAAKWPLVLFLHGGGERGDDIEKVKIHGPPKLVAQGKQFPFMLVSPQCPTGAPRPGWNADELAALVDDLAAKYRVDRQRLYVTGLRMGGAGTWSLV